MGAGSSTKKKAREKEDRFDPAPRGTVERLSHIERRRRSSLLMAAANEEGAAGANVDLPAEVMALLPPEAASAKQLGRQYRPTIVVRSNAPSPGPGPGPAAAGAPPRGSGLCAPGSRALSPDYA